MEINFHLTQVGRLFVVVFRPTREFFTYLETSLLLMKANEALSSEALKNATPTVTRGIRL